MKLSDILYFGHLLSNKMKCDELNISQSNHRSEYETSSLWISKFDGGAHNCSERKNDLKMAQQLKEHKLSHPFKHVGFPFIPGLKTTSSPSLLKYTSTDHTTIKGKLLLQICTMRGTDTVMPSLLCWSLHICWCTDLRDTMRQQCK